MARRVLMADVSGGRVREIEVKVALGSTGMTVEAARQFAKDRKEWRALVHMFLNEFHAAIFAWPFRTTLPCSGGYHLERGGIPLHDADVNCNRCATTENQGSDVKYMAMGCMLMIVCVLSDLM